MPDVIGYLIGGFLYLVSQKYRDKKKKEWDDMSELYKIYEIGMWVSIPIFILTVVVLAVVSNGI
ncbi:MAG: hypothetical protein AB2697_14340 [Candidatus Thiodiazotropha endolucinida]